MVREAVVSAVPVKRKTSERERPKLEPAMAFVDAVLEADKTAPRKQRHTAHRIWCRIRAEMPEVEVAESTIRRYVRERKTQLGLLQRETFIPQSYAWGQEAQVDWYEAYADIGGEREKAYVFCMRSMASGGAFHCAFPHCSQQAFLEAHELGFAYFLGVFKTLRYDVEHNKAENCLVVDDRIGRCRLDEVIPGGCYLCCAAGFAGSPNHPHPSETSGIPKIGRCPCPWLSNLDGGHPIFFVCGVATWTSDRARMFLQE